MRLFRKNNRNKGELIFECEASTATRAMKAENRHFPVIQMKFDLKQPKVDKKTAQEVDEVTIYMDLDEAVKFANQLLSSIGAATPRMPRQAFHGMWGE